MKALVLVARSGQFKCELECGEIVDAIARKKTMAGASRSNPIIAGDQVELALHGQDYAIESLHPRKTLITRGSETRRGKQHAIVANVDHALLVFASKNPRSRVSGIDRYLVACEYQHLKAVIVFNKWELRDRASEALTKIYEDAGYTILKTMALQSPEEAREQISNIPFEKMYVLGPSGVGKSSLINALIPEHHATTGSVNNITGKGRQTTTHIELVCFGQHRYITDTPGLGQLTMLGIEPNNLKNFYREFLKLSEQCRYADCLHLSEPNCAVKDAIGDSVHEDRYKSYTEFYADLVEEKERDMLRGKK